MKLLLFWIVFLGLESNSRAIDISEKHSVILESPTLSKGISPYSSKLIALSGRTRPSKILINTAVWRRSLASWVDPGAFTEAAKKSFFVGHQAHISNQIPFFKRIVIFQCWFFSSVHGNQQFSMNPIISCFHASALSDRKYLSYMWRTISRFTILNTCSASDMVTPNRSDNVLNKTEWAKRYRVHGIWWCSSIGLGTKFVGFGDVWTNSIQNQTEYFSCYTQPLLKLFVIHSL